MSNTDASKTIKQVECRFAVHCKSKDDESDLHLIKEVITYEDGTQTPNVKLIKDYKRDFYVTKKGKQNHQSLKEWEDIENLDKYTCTQNNLTSAVAAALGKPWSRESLRELCSTPYVYGADILSTSIIKQTYRDKVKEITPIGMAAFDTETDVLHGTGEIVMGSLAYKEKAFCAVTKNFVSGHTEVIDRVHTLCDTYISEVMAKRNLKIEIQILDNEIEVVKALMAKAHEWSPDVMAVWNIEFDMDKIIEACERANLSVEDLLSDPKVPKSYRHFRFKKGPAKKVTASGRVMNFKPSQRWHTVFSPSSFYWLCAMSTYRQVRGGEAEEPSYGLDAILKKHKIGGKLKFTEADHLTGLEWHKFMQSKYPLHYIVYNLYDCIGMLELDEATNDIRLSLPMFAGCTDWQNFNSQPRKTMDALHWYVKTKGKIVGCTSGDMTEEVDEETTDLSGWITMLPSHLVVDNGLMIVTENELLATNIRVCVADLDVSAAYPTNEIVENVSKETTSKELIKIQFVTEEDQRRASINLSGGRTNSVEVCTTILKLPELSTLLDIFKTQQNPAIVGNEV